MAEVRLDWIEATFNHSQLDVLTEWCGKFDMVALDRGAMGYDCSANFAGSGLLLWCSDDAKGDRQGVHVSIPSKALDNITAQGYNTTRLLNTLSLFDAKVTRLDVAYDDRPGCEYTTGLLDFDTILNAIESDDYVSRSRQVRLMKYLKGGKGTTVYFGSGQSDSLLRIYDKAAEQKIEEHWIRVELQLRRERAHALYLLLSNEYSVEDFDIGAVLLAVLDFKRHDDDDTNKSRWQTAEWWIAFVRTASKIHLSKARLCEDSVERSNGWIQRQVAPTLAFLMQAKGGDSDYLTGVLVNGLRRMTKARRALALAYITRMSSDECNLN